MQIDRAQSARVYWEAVSENARAEGLQGTCGDSYGTNALAMMFAFAYGSGVNYNTPLTLAFYQALALHQASGLVDAISYTRPAMSQEQRVVRSAIPSTGAALHCSQQPGPRGRHGCCTPPHCSEYVAFRGSRFTTGRAVGQVPSLPLDEFSDVRTSTVRRAGCVLEYTDLSILACVACGRASKPREKPPLPPAQQLRRIVHNRTVPHRRLVRVLRSRK
jgi:hypothetical protein